MTPGLWFCKAHPFEKRNCVSALAYKPAIMRFKFRREYLWSMCSEGSRARCAYHREQGFAQHVSLKLPIPEIVGALT
jgi:hypothetical protein